MKEVVIPEKYLTRKDEITSDFLKLAEKHIDDIMHNRAERMFHASDFASLLFVHPRHLTNTIKLTTGKSPCDVMEEHILAHSQKLLRETDKPVKEIAAIFFYFDASNFIKFFKGMCGFTPLQYRKNMRLTTVS